MASDRNLVDLIVENASDAGEVSARAMFGEFAIYCGNKLVALVCDDQLFVKSTPGSEALLPEAERGSPYPGAKPCLIVGEGLEDREFLSHLLRITADELPEPKPKAKGKAKAKRAPELGRASPGPSPQGSWTW